MPETCAQLLTCPGHVQGRDPVTRQAAQLLVESGPDFGAEGTAGRCVHTAIDRAIGLYAGAPVRSVVGVLVERTVRQELSISTTPG